MTGDRIAYLVEKVSNGLEDLGSNSRTEEQLFSSTKLSDLHWAHKTSYLVNTGIFTKVKAAVA